MAICQELNRQLVGEGTVEVLCEGPSGWKKGAESVVAGAVAEQVELGVTLQMGMNRGRVEVATAREEVQLTGRTTSDQIVVFNGGRELEGRIVKVRVNEAHGLTIFGSVVGTQSAQITKSAGDPVLIF